MDVSAPRTPENVRDERLDELTRLFGSYKAEWLNQQIYDLFARPSYLPNLKNNQSCVLLGGRGTGKTTVLRGLSYEGQRQLTSVDPSEWESYGLYYCVDLSHLSALTGRGLSDEEWHRPFGHHLNLLFSDLLIRFLLWYQDTVSLEDDDFTTLDPAWRVYEKTLSLSFPENRDHSIHELAESVRLALVDFGLYVNNIDDPTQKRPVLSVIRVGLDALVDAIRTLPGLAGKTFFFLLDQYEHFSDYQQQVCNTLIKDSPGRPYCFKVGVRELGWRQRYTLNDQELREPSDYRKVDISELLSGKHFNDFALNVLTNRLSHLSWFGDESGPQGVRALFPSLTIHEEAVVLGVEKHAKGYLSELPSLPRREQSVLEILPLPLVWFAVRWGKADGQTVPEALQSLAEDPECWDRRFRGNYGYASLFAIRPGKIRKLYAGWDVYLKLASGNIRFFLQLVEEALRLHIMRGKGLDVPIAPDTQTMAAHTVGQRNFEELQGLDVRGARMMRLLLGVGRLFQIMAWEPFKHAPEVNQFAPTDPDDDSEPTSEIAVETLKLLEASVNHLALQRTPGTKLWGDVPRGFEYWIHPIFSAFFQISHRRKRRTSLSLEEIYYLATDQKRVIGPILKRHGREEELVERLPLPPQLDLFYAPAETVA